MHAVPGKARRGQWIPWNWNYKQLSASVWVLGIKPRSLGRAAEPSPQPMDFPVLKVFLLVLVLISGLYKFLGPFYINSLSRIHFANIFSLPELPFILLVVSLAAQSI